MRSLKGGFKTVKMKRKGRWKSARSSNNTADKIWGRKSITSRVVNRTSELSLKRIVFQSGRCSSDRLSRETGAYTATIWNPRSLQVVVQTNHSFSHAPFVTICNRVHNIPWTAAKSQSRKTSSSHTDPKFKLSDDKTQQMQHCSCNYSNGIICSLSILYSD